MAQLHIERSLSRICCIGLVHKDALVEENVPNMKT